MFSGRQREYRSLDAISLDSNPNAGVDGSKPVSSLKESNMNAEHKARKKLGEIQNVLAWRLARARARAHKQISAESLEVSFFRFASTAGCVRLLHESNLPVSVSSVFCLILLSLEADPQTGAASCGSSSCT